MSRSNKIKAHVETTRDRILSAAIQRFGRNSYEETGLRDIAADSGVDVAFVHRSFGSKEQLFAAALHAVLLKENFQAPSLECVIRRLVRTGLAVREEGEIRPMDIASRSFSSPVAARAIRTLIAEDFVAPLRSGFPVVGERDATLAAAILCGVLIVRDVVAAPAISMEDSRPLENVMAKLLHAVLCPMEPREPSGGSVLTKSKGQNR